MSPQDNSFVQKFLDKFSRSRDFTISFLLHLIIVFIFGTTVLFQAIQVPSDIEGAPGGLVQAAEQAVQAPPQQVQPQNEMFDVSSVPVGSPTSAPSLNTITSDAPNALNFTMPPTISPVMNSNTTTAHSTVSDIRPGSNVIPNGLPGTAASQIKEFTGGWGEKGTGGGVGNLSREFKFTAYIGQYSGGNWNSTVRVVNNSIQTGSLPNLLYLMRFWSKEKIKTNYKNVKAIRLDSDEIFAIKPPFIFLTGTRDFKLTEKEVENLRKYVQLGGCIWGTVLFRG